MTLPKAPELGKVLKNYRLDRGMTQKEFAVFLGLSRTTLVRVEAGEDVGDLNRRKVEKKIGKALEMEAA